MASRALPDLIARIRLDSSGVDEALGGLTKSFSRTNLEMAGVVAGIAGIATITKSFIDLAGQNADAQSNLSQAYKTQGLTLTDHQGTIDSFLNTNKSFIDNQYQAKDAIASFTRAGFDQTTVFRLMNDSIDYAAIKHVSLADAAHTLMLAEMGNTRALRDLGIPAAEVSAIFKAAPASLKDVTKATTEVEKATDANTTAIQKLSDWETTHSNRAKLTQADLITERKLKENVVTTSGSLKDANDHLATAENGVTTNAHAQAQLLDILEPKIAKGRDTTSDLKKHQNELAAAWDHLANDSGPPLIGVLTALTGGAASFLDALGDPKKWAGISTFFVNLAKQLQALGVIAPKNNIPGAYDPGGRPAPGVFAVPQAPFRSLASGGIVSGLPGMPQQITAHGGEAVIRGDQLDQLVGYLATIARNTSSGPSFSTTAYGRS